MHWHPDHIAERYGLFTIIVLGECVLASSNAIRDGVAERGVDLSVVAVGGGGLVLVFALWWLYYLNEAAPAFGGRLKPFL